MSIRVMSWVWEQSAAEGLDRLVLLAIADNADDRGGNAWPSVETLRLKAKVSERTVQRAIRRLVALGELQVESRAGMNRVNIYCVVMTPRHTDTPSESHPVTESPTPGVSETPGGVTEAEGGVTQSDSPRHTDTQSVLEPSLTPESPKSVVAVRRGTRLPEGWRPTPDTISWTIQHLDRESANREIEKFRNYWYAKPGKDATKLDWDRTWRNWVLNAAPAKRRNSTTDERVMQGLELVEQFRQQEESNG